MIYRNYLATHLSFLIKIIGVKVYEILEMFLFIYIITI